MKRIEKKWTASFLATALVLTGIAGCGTSTNTNNSTNTSNSTNQTSSNTTSTTNDTSTTNNTSATTTNAPAGSVLAKVKKSGKLEIGTEGTYAPFTYHNSKDQLTGFDVELAQAVAKRLGVKADFVETPWDGMFAGLNDKRFDMIANEVGILPSRQKKYLFSDPYIKSSAVIIVRDNDNKIKSFNDLKGVKDAQSMTSNYAKTAKKYDANVTSVKGFNEAIQLVKSGRVEATINDKLSFLQLKKQNPNIGLKIAATSSDTTPSGFMFRKGEPDLVKAVDKALQSIIQDGTYEKISDKYFGTNVLK